MRKQHISHGGRGSGRPPDKFKYGKRVCIYVGDYDTKQLAYKIKDKYEKDGILAVVRKYYSKWAVYRCGERKRRV